MSRPILHNDSPEISTTPQDASSQGIQAIENAIAPLDSATSPHVDKNKAASFPQARRGSGRVALTDKGINQHLQLLPKHRKELKASCISANIIAASFYSVEGDRAVDLLTSEAIGNLGGWAQQYSTGPVIKLRRRYQNVKAGGWWVSGLDPLNDWSPMEWGQLKPDIPRTGWEKAASGEWKSTDKIIKYEAPAKVSPRAIFLAGAVDWAEVQGNAETAIVIGEGAKKAGAMLTAGYAAIALPGVNSGYRSRDKLGNPITPHLIPEIEKMVANGRTVYLAFDQDEKLKTQQKVASALSRFGRLLQEKGCKVKVVRWSPSAGKGADDLIANHGVDTFHQAIKDALTLEEFEIWQVLDNRLAIAPSIRLKAHDLTVLSPESLPDSGIIAIASAKGTGKTKLIGGIIADQDKALLAGHRISLMRNLSERCGVNYRGDLDKQGGRFFNGDAYTLRVGTCVDSLLAFNPKDFAGCDLVLDEVVQVLRHLLTSKTCNKDGMRPVLLARFRELVQVARRVIIADADLDSKAIAYIQQLRGDSGQAFLIRNDYQAPGYPVRFIEAPDASAITGELLKDIQAGKRIYIATDSKRASKRIAQIIDGLPQEVSYILINSDTSGGEVERDFMEDPDQDLAANGWQVAIASPSAGTGLSQEMPYFDGVYGIFYGGSIPDADMSQGLIRVRQPVPRTVWCAKHGSAFSKVGRESSALKLLNLLKQKTDANTRLIQSSLTEAGAATVTGYDWANDPHVNYWSKLEAERNRSMWNLRTALKVRLMHEGHQLTVTELGSDSTAKDLLKRAREDLKIEHCLAVEVAENLTPAEAKALAQLDGIDEKQRLALEKWNIAEFYCLPVDEVDADLVLWDNDGRRRGQLTNLENFLNEDVAINSDVRSLERQVKWQAGITPWDLHSAALKRVVRNELKLAQYLDPSKVWDSASLEDFKAIALKFAPQIKAALNFSVKEDMAPAQILNQLLEQMGVECHGKQQRRDGARVRSYQIDSYSWRLNQEVLARRKARRERLAEDVTPSLSNNFNQRGVTPLEAPEIENRCNLAPAPIASNVTQPSLLLPNLRDDYYDPSAWEAIA